MSVLPATAQSVEDMDTGSNAGEGSWPLEFSEATLTAARQSGEIGSTAMGKRITVDPGDGIQSGTPPIRLSLSVGKSDLVPLPPGAQEVVVGDPAIADVSMSSRQSMMVIGRSAGETNIFIIDSRGNEITRVDISVGPDTEAVRRAIGLQFPDALVSVNADGSALVLSGSVSSDGEAGRIALIARRFVEGDDDLINLLRVSREQQVLIQVRVAEVQRNILKELGTGIQINNNPNLKTAEVSATVTTQSLGLNPLNQFAGSFSIQGIRDLFVTLDLLERRGLVRSLAEPNLVAVSGETASMLAGGEIPVPVPDRDGVKIEYKPFGVSLAFLPVILDTGNISLKLSTEVSALSSERVDVPLLTGSASINAFTVRRASTTVELPSGGSLMIAGLIQNDILTGMNGIPGMMDIPILGQLFRSQSFRRNETELVIIVTASLVRPVAPVSLVAPTDSLSPGTMMDSIIFGRMMKRYAPGFVHDTNSSPTTPMSFGFTIDEIKQ